MNPGEPENAVRDFKRIYWALNQYALKYKKLPTPMALMDTSKPLMAGIQLAPEDFENPDAEYAEFDASAGPPLRPYSFSFYVPSKPPPGSPVLKEVPAEMWNRSALPKKGEKYVWADTWIYTRSNAKIMPDGRTHYHYSGYHIVLWSNGSIEKIPESKILLHKITEKSWRRYYPGQLGVPKDVFPVAKQWEELNARAKEPYITWE